MNITNENLQQENSILRQHVAELTVKLNWYEEQFRLNQHRRFGQSSEQTNINQISLFDEAEKEATSKTEEPTIEKITYKRKKSQGKREAQLKDLPVEVIEYKLNEDEQVCPCCEESLHEMSKEIRKELKIVPAKVSVVEHVRYVYACRNCEKENITTPIITASMPKPVLKGSLASPSIMAYVMSQKFVESMPLYRQEKQFERIGIEIPRQTLANWMIEGSERWLSHIYNRMHEILIKKDIICADETTLQVLKEEGRSAGSTSYMWLYRTGREGPPIILYDYQTTRASKHPVKFLTNFKGYLNVDGYASYNKIDNITLVGCWAHARRKFNEALNALPSNKRLEPVGSKEGLDFCNQLFAIERILKDATPKERYKQRLKQSQPVLDAFFTWLKYQRPRVLPKSKFGQAITYCLNQWDKLNNFMLDGRLEIDNNRSERAIKPFVIGRKNWLFANTARGASSSAVIYSVVETAKENGLNPFEYLTFLFEKLPNVDINDKDVIDELLPWSDKLPQSCKIPIKK